MFRKEFTVVIIIAVLVFIFGVYISQNQAKLVTEYPQQSIELEDTDFMFTYNNNTLKIGSSASADVLKVFPHGEILGLSTIYSPNDLDCLFTFTEHSDILHKMHISDDQIITARGAKVGESFDSVVDKYGQSYASVHKVDNLHDFDAVYGNDNNRCIVFQVRGGLVTKIILQKDPPGRL
ncbi:MAG: hypothetical protein PHD40_00415 [Syntrophomonadaceae bacterium]|nr:hypothetical protein [Syntrophomonadaceae bacterium]